jgi:hypothetical protein
MTNEVFAALPATASRPVKRAYFMVRIDRISG